MQRIEIVRLALRHFGIEPARLGGIAGLVGLQRVPQHPRQVARRRKAL
ncbi:MAG TPA: hypothetical protein VE396_14490 [Xanthobacteraceae bacterium]|jgi:hypothetical protein|nr:hypothetical protein [Xanthobacteraceae bacterium]